MRGARLGTRGGAASRYPALPCPVLPRLLPCPALACLRCPAPSLPSALARCRTRICILDQHVFWLEIAVDDPRLVQHAQRVQDLRARMWCVCVVNGWRWAGVGLGWAIRGANACAPRRASLTARALRCAALASGSLLPAARRLS